MGWRIFVNKSVAHPGFVRNPYPLYRKLRQTHPVRRDPIAPVWVITSYADTFAMLRDPRFRKDPFAQERLPRGARQQLGLTEKAAARASFEQTSMLFLDPPHHTRIRSIFNKTFTPRRLESLRTRIQVITDELLDAVAGRSEIELINDLAAPLPVIIISELLGFPPEDRLQIKKWSDDMTIALSFAATKAQRAIANTARDEIQEYFQRLVEKLRKQPGDNLLSALLQPESAGEDLNPDELFSNSIMLLAAGHETTTNLIGNGMLALLRNPDQLRELRDHPDELIEPAIEELLRYDPPVQWTSRVAGEDMEFGGQKMRKGEIVVASVGAANRDPAVFKDPDRLDIRRADNKHLSFGTGVHFCLGAALARWEGQIAIAALLRRFPNLQLASRRVRWRKGITFRGLHELRLKL
jgi:cytochrome P450